MFFLYLQKLIVNFHLQRSDVIRFSLTVSLESLHVVLRLHPSDQSPAPPPEQESLLDLRVEVAVGQGDDSSLAPQWNTPVNPEVFDGGPCLFTWRLI